MANVVASQISFTHQEHLVMKYYGLKFKDDSILTYSLKFIMGYKLSTPKIRLSLMLLLKPQGILHHRTINSFCLFKPTYELTNIRAFCSLYLFSCFIAYHMPGVAVKSTTIQNSFIVYFNLVDHFQICISLLLKFA